VGVTFPRKRDTKEGDVFETRIKYPIIQGAKALLERLNSL